MTFEPCDPKRPQIKIWADNFCRGYLVDVYAWVTWLYHVICRRNSIFGENDLLITVTPNDPKLKIEPITFVEGI